jgi:competence protein ComEC
MRAAYRAHEARWWHTLTDVEVAAVVAGIIAGIWLRHVGAVIAVGVAFAVLGLRRVVALTCVVAGSVGIVVSNAAWNGVKPDHLGHFEGLACLINDPTPKNGAVVVVLELDGERFETWARGSPRRRLEPRLAGECALMRGERRQLTGVTGRRAAIRHVVGGFNIDSIADWRDRDPLDRASNRVRRVFALGAAELRTPDDSLFAGLVMGDDRNEPVVMIDQFRASGLSHLTAVSGQNVAYVLAAAAPLLRRLRPWIRWLTTLVLIAWFIALTRFEPSVLRAGVMAGIAATGFVLGREKPPGRVLALAVGLLVLVDPLLVWSVGFWLSVAATAGVALLSGRIASWIPGPDWIAVPAGVTLAAQIGVAPVSLLVFGTLPLVSLPANLLAVPVAGLVMLYGLPAGLLAGALHGDGATGWMAQLIQVPSAFGTRWVATVAALAARLEPPAPWSAVGWAGVATSVAAIALHRRAVARRAPLCEGVLGR